MWVPRRLRLALLVAILVEGLPARVLSADLASALIARAEGLREDGRQAEAEPLLRRALQIQRSTLGPSDPAYVTTLNQLGVLLKERNQYAESERMLREAISLTEH